MKWFVPSLLWILFPIPGLSAWAVDLELTTSPGFDIFETSGSFTYRYGASLIINDDDSIDFWACSEGGGPFPGVADVIRYRHSTDGGATWTPEVAALMPTANSPDAFATCDP